MSNAADSNPIEVDPAAPAASRAPALSPATEYQKALERYEGYRLYEMQRSLGLTEPGARSRGLAVRIVERLEEPRIAERLLADLGSGSRMLLGLFGLTELAAWPLEGLNHSLTCLGVETNAALMPLLDLGLVALDAPESPPVSEFSKILIGEPQRTIRVVAHPAALAAARTVLPEIALTGSPGKVRQVRESDSLEPPLRLAAVWQRVDDSPLRWTQQGTLYKRDRDRLEDDPVLAGPMADALEPLPDMAALWIALARGIGLLIEEPEGDRIVAAGPDFWRDNAVHLPHMLAVRWLGLRTWHEQGGMQREGAEAALALPFVRPAVLLWLATLAEDEWVAFDDLASHLRRLAPDWDRPAFVVEAPVIPPSRGRVARGKKEAQPASNGREGTLEALLLGAAYQFGVVRAGESEDDRRVVQLSPLGRYVLALGPPPPPRPTFDHFLYVQPNFEIIAYRQGLTPALIGQFSRFAHWSQVGAALELKLTPQSVYRGLEGGLEPTEMLDRLTRHSSRPLPAGVSEAVRTWAERRERVTYYASTTLIEFATHAELEEAVAHWPSAARPAPIVVSDRLLLVEDASSIPFQRFRMTGARDYRREPEACLESEGDGVTLTLDIARSDLLVDAELVRFTEELPPESDKGAPGTMRRKFRVSRASLARGLRHGLTLGLLENWYSRRTGADMPPSVRLLLQAAGPRVAPLATSRPLVLHTPSPELLEGLLQHPDTQNYLGDRLGPTTVVIPEALLASFRRALEALGLAISDPGETPVDGELDRPPTQARRTPKG